jgi:hypothetical protein
VSHAIGGRGKSSGAKLETSGSADGSTGSLPARGVSPSVVEGGAHDGLALALL